ncbi:hypothetical protein CR51_15190 [Caballeronia megalochromosomata]|nr:hypothetical protein CR51_15190 [Caballeronia megalochromosomata]
MCGTPTRQITLEPRRRTLPNHQQAYREGRVPYTREMVVLPNCIIVYRVKRDRILIVVVLHARQRFP